MRCLLYTFHGSSVFYPLIHILPSHPRFTLLSAFYPLMRVLLSYIRVLLSRPSVRLSAFYTFIRVLLSYPRFTLSSAFYSHIRVLSSNPCFTPLYIRVLHIHPYPPFTLTPSSTCKNDSSSIYVIT